MNTVIKQKTLVAVTGLLTLGLVSFAVFGNKAEAESLDKTEIETIIHDYLMKNPEVIIEAVSQLQQREEQQAKVMASEFLKNNRDAIENGPGAFTIGNLEGDITIVEFFDYHCGFCKRALPGLIKTVEKDKNIKLVLREFPVLGPDSRFAAKAAMAAIDQDKYEDLHMEMMKANGKLTRSRIENMVIKVGMDLVRFNASVANPEYDKILAANLDLAHGLGMQGTPAFVIGDHIIHGLKTGEELRAIIADIRAS